MSAAGSSSARRLIVPAALVVAGLLFCFALVAPAVMPILEWTTAAALLRAGFSLLCHQDPGRSFHLWGSPLAVCIRCSGIYAGFVMGCGAVLAARCAGRALAAPRGRMLTASIAPMAMEWAAELAGFPDASGFMRTSTGALFGFAAAFFVVHAVEELPREMAAELDRLTSPARSAHGKAS